MYYKQYFFLLILVAWGLGNSQSLLWYNLSYNDKYFFHKNDINSKSCVWGLNRGQGCEVLKRPKTGLKCKCQRTRRDPRGRKENRDLPICCLLSRYSEERVMGTDFFWRLFGILDILCDTQPVTHTPVLRQTLVCLLILHSVYFLCGNEERCFKAGTGKPKASMGENRHFFSPLEY